MSMSKVFLLVLLLSVPVTDGRALRERRQTAYNQLGQDMSNIFSNGYNTIREYVAPIVSSTVDRLSQNWDRYKQNLNQGVNQLSQGWDQYKQTFNQGINQVSQGWNQFTQNINPPQSPYVNNRNYPYNNQYGYNNQQYPYAVNYNVPPNYGDIPANQYPTNNYINPYGQPRGNMVGQWNPNFAGQQRSNGINTPMYGIQRPPPPPRRR